MDCYTANEIKEILRLKKKEKVYELCRSNRFPCFKLGRDWLIDKDGFDKWMSSKMTLAK